MNVSGYGGLAIMLAKISFAPASRALAKAIRSALRSTRTASVASRTGRTRGCSGACGALGRRVRSSTLDIDDRLYAEPRKLCTMRGTRDSRQVHIDRVCTNWYKSDWQQFARNRTSEE